MITKFTWGVGVSCYLPKKYWDYDCSNIPPQELVDKAFTKAEKDKKLAKSEVENALKQLKIEYASVKVSFSEFDSGNVSHACAHWDVEITSEKSIKKLSSLEKYGLVKDVQ